MISTVEGFCYHCMDCEYFSGFLRPSVDHSEKENHGIVRKFRGNCEKHNGNGNQNQA